MRIQAVTEQDWQELERTLEGINLFLRAVRTTAEKTLGPSGRPALAVIEGTRRSAKSRSRKRPVLRVVD